MIKTTETEQEFVNKLKITFSKQFTVKSEVWSKCKNGRIDLLLKLNDNVYFGIECKAPNEKRGEKIGEYIKQAYRYSEYEFEVEKGIYKKIAIFICPALSYNYLVMRNETIIHDGKEYHKDRHYEFNSHHTLNGILGSMCIGEVRKSWDKNYFFSMSNSTVYHSKYGLNDKNYAKLLKKLGI